jgi:ferredoxin-thioredoxin reductase catalytic subunit
MYKIKRGATTHWLKIWIVDTDIAEDNICWCKYYTKEREADAEEQAQETLRELNKKWPSTQ